MRSAEFDREQVLRAAMTAFMEKGYAKTSMQDLKAATGLHPGSIYCAFQNKRGLLLAALEQYNRDRGDELQALFSQFSSARAGLAAYLTHVVDECVSCDPQKLCLTQKALNELAEQDTEAQAILSEQCAMWRNALCAVFERIADQGELTGARTPLDRARSLIVSIYGLRTFAHTHPEPQIMRDLGAQILKDVCQ
ncbi:TetR/AcrR family transcriptional regulator [Pseudoalteromonas rubra]|uniref:TetR family transcriptional regulator n=1 Tax=Pseudoalteromonas rubra TaxID=43658 RepID=A0A5S3WRY1_9GAMM|nr:TetR/AcrR family transcriptional regulator [Pseudoalteromonas rubra]TMP31046.1 TetR family transcriptional regulator [Pseudoalteromonas rubra]